MKKFRNHIEISSVYFFCLGLLFLSGITTYAQDKTELAAKGLHGKVDTLMETEYTNQLQKNDLPMNFSSSGPHSTHEEDEHGNQVTLKFFDRTNKLVFQYYFTYDSTNTLTEKTIKNPDGLGITRWVYNYDSNGFPKNIEEYQINRPQRLTNLQTTHFISKKLTHFDITGKTIENISFNEDGSAIEKKSAHKPAKDNPNNSSKEAMPVDKFDDNGKITERDLPNTDGTIKGKIYYKYDDKGHELEQDYYRESDQFKTILTMNEYDIAGRLTSRTMNRIDGAHGDKFEYKYDEKGNKIAFSVYLWKDGYHLYKVERYNATGSIKEQENYDETGNFESKFLFVYDSYGNIMKKQSRDKDNSIIAETIYNYALIDKQGNWHARSIWNQDDNTVTITQREIIYYKMK